MKPALYILSISIFVTVSCTKEDFIENYPAEISFNISSHLLEGKKIKCIEVDKSGNIYAGSGNKLYCISGNNITEYCSGTDILDLSLSPDKTLWIGSANKGLGRLRGNDFIWYNKENSGLPRDYVAHVEVAPDGRVWFTSCASDLGGLGIYDGKTFEFLTPDNSPLNQNLIEDLEIGDDGSIYIASSGKVGHTNIYRIKGNKWECLGDENGTFYWVFNFTVSPSGIIYLVEDFSLSSTFRTNKVFKFEDNKWYNIDIDSFLIPYFFNIIKADRRGFCWLAGSAENPAMLYVYDGKKWTGSPEGILPEDFITVIETDFDNNIYVGTYNNGIFIINQ
ncbi:MAG TPA: hypothetical protein PLN06_03440 [Bacteroidales bacterium]|nr:hypothetical protein [Bacteroidales bacterium]HCI55417.1 hypothetical protein [Bacteroidales bacterium]HOU95660.1 hypothetical protein [Bacteroidales bacterium]HQG36015.1 hypothetical protein [Bacteroidales bacterium]HQG53179.1 hypothetical protein [Bacteroidales bacterium]